MDDHQFRQLLNHFGLSWDGYRRVRKGVKKRIVRHMKQLGCRSMEGYLSALDQNQEACLDCERLMTVSVSRFFRDRGLWQTLENEIMPSIIRDHAGTVRVWSAGCACGEEVYTLKILWQAIEGRFGPQPELEIWATDMNPIYLEKARAGVYARSSLKEVPEAIRDVYFKTMKKGKRYAVSQYLKERVIWQLHNLLSDPPGAGFQLIFLRNNLLTYYEEALKAPAFQKVVNALDQGGYLVIGTHEKIPPGVQGLLSLSRHPYVLRKRKKSHNIVLCAR